MAACSSIMQDSNDIISRRLFFDMPRERTKLALVCGGKSVSGSIARQVAAAYRAGLFEKIVVTGGVPAGSLIEGAAIALHAMQRGALRDGFNRQSLRDMTTKKLEADYIENILLDAGVWPSTIIHVDRTATNTQQNIENCQQILIDADTVTFFTYAPVQRRTIGIFRKYVHFNHVALQSIPVFPFGITRDNWHLWPVGPIVRGEYEKMNPENPNNYMAKGFCVDPNIDAEISHMRLAAG